MAVEIKSLGLPIPIKTVGVEFEIRTTDNKEQLGDLYITGSKIIWCKGRTSKENGVSLSWDKFIKLVEASKPSSKTAGSDLKTSRAAQAKARKSSIRTRTATKK